MKKQKKNSNQFYIKFISLLLFSLILCGCQTSRQLSEEENLKLRNSIKNTVFSHRTSLVGCFKEYQGRYPGKYGRVNYLWDVDPAGKVKNIVKELDEFKDQKLDDCLIVIIQSMNFPKLETDFLFTRRVRFPFIYTKMEGIQLSY